MEVNGRDPVSVTFTSHDVLGGVHVPDLPGAVIGGCGNDLLPHVEGHATDALIMGLDLFLIGESSWEDLVILGKVRIGPSILWVGGIFSNAFTDGALSKERLVGSSVLSLLLSLMHGFNIF